MTENPVVKYVKFRFVVTLLINFRHTGIIASVAPNLAVLQIVEVFWISVISDKRNVSTEIYEEFTEKKIEKNL